jgi:hypothetical protein
MSQLWAEIGLSNWHGQYHKYQIINNRLMAKYERKMGNLGLFFFFFFFKMTLFSNYISWDSDADQTEFGASLLLRSSAHRVPYINFMFLVVKLPLFPCFSSIRVLRVFISLLY